MPPAPARAQVTDAEWASVWAPAHWTVDGASLDCVAAQLTLNTAAAPPFPGAWLEVACSTALPYWCVGPVGGFAAPPPPPPGAAAAPPAPSPLPPFDVNYPAYPAGEALRGGNGAE